MDTREELLGKLRSATFSLVFQAEKQERRKELCEKINGIESELKREPSIDVSGWIFLTLLCFIVGAIPIPFRAFLYLHISDKPLITPFTIICFVIGGLLIIATIVSYKKQLHSYSIQQHLLTITLDDRINPLKEEIAQIDTILSECSEIMDTCLKFIPSKYRNLHAVAFMYEAVDNRRADTLKEVINLYEAHLSDLESKHAMQAAARMQQEQLASINELMQQMSDSQERMADDVNQMKLMQLYEKYNKDYE